MKAKLLKKIRKRFKIEKIESFATNEHWSIRKFIINNNIVLPAFQVIDNDASEWDENLFYYNSLPEAINCIKMLINIKYFEKFKHKSRVKSKVWYMK